MTQPGARETGEAFGHDVNLALTFAAQAAQRARENEQDIWAQWLQNRGLDGTASELLALCARCHPTPERHDLEE